MQAEDLLKVTIPVAVNMRIMEMVRLPEDRRPAAKDIIKCEDCLGMGKVAAPRGDGPIEITCATCDGRGVLKRGEFLASYVAVHGDALIFGGRKGAAARAFNALSEALSLLAFAHGGVDFCGLHFEAQITRPAYELAQVNRAFYEAVELMPLVKVIKKVEASAVKFLKVDRG